MGDRIDETITDYAPEESWGIKAWRWTRRGLAVAVVLILMGWTFVLILLATQGVDALNDLRRNASDQEQMIAELREQNRDARQDAREARKAAQASQMESARLRRHLDRVIVQLRERGEEPDIEEPDRREPSEPPDETNDSNGEDEPTDPSGDSEPANDGNGDDEPNHDEDNGSGSEPSDPPSSPGRILDDPICVNLLFFEVCV